MYLTEGPMGQGVRDEQAEADRHYSKVRIAAAATRERIAKLLNR